MSTAAERSPRSTSAASALIFAFGAIVALNALAAAVTGTATGADLSFAMLLLMATGVSGWGLRRTAGWAWWASLVLAVIGLFFVLPVAGTILFSGTLDPVGTGWDFVFFPLTTVILIALVASLLAVRREVTERA